MVIFNIKRKMKIKLIALAIPMMVALWSCQSDSPQDIQSPKKVLTVNASLPGSDNTRAIIKYGDYEDSSREELIWVKDIPYLDRTMSDYIKLFNISHFTDNHYGSKETPYLEITDISGKKATFASLTEYPDFSVKAGDILLAVQGFADPANKDLVAEGSTNVISYQASSALYDQKIVKEPTTLTAMSHMFFMQHMYDIVKVEKDNVIPDLHFKHFNAIIRVTLQNKTGKQLFDKYTELVFTTSSADGSSFLYGFNYFSVVGNDEDGYRLQENFKETPKRHPLCPIPPEETVYLSNKTSHFINKSENNRIPLENDSTYELYVVVTPRVGYSENFEKFTIDLYDGVESSFYADHEDVNKYTITIDDFNRAIEPGKRYWFKLTACNEIAGEEEIDTYEDGVKTGNKKKIVNYKLMLTSEWEANHKKNE